MCKDCWFSKYNKVLLHYSVSIAAAAAYIHLSAAAAAYIHLSVAAVVVGCQWWWICMTALDTNELFHAYFFYVST